MKFIKLTPVRGESAYYNIGTILSLAPHHSTQLGEGAEVLFSGDRSVVLVKESVDDILAQLENKEENTETLSALKECDDLLRNVLHTLSEENGWIESIRCRLRDNVRFLHDHK